MKNHYKTLRLKILSSKDEVRNAYLKLAQEYHPDKNNGSEFFNEYFKEIKESYEFLIEENNKNKYDEIIKNNPELIEITDLSIPNEDLNNIPNKRKIDFIRVATFLLIIFIICFVTYSLVSKTQSVQINSDTSQLHTIDNKLNNEYLPPPVCDTTVPDSPAIVNSGQNTNNTLTNEPTKNINFKDKISVEINGDNLLIINKNKFSIFRVAVEIHYQYGEFKDEFNVLTGRFDKSLPTYDTKQFSFFNISPGINNVTGEYNELMLERDAMWFATILYCERN
jgi:hypothetical protein